MLVRPTKAYSHPNSMARARSEVVVFIRGGDGAVEGVGMLELADLATDLNEMRGVECLWRGFA